VSFKKQLLIESKRLLQIKTAKEKNRETKYYFAFLNVARDTVTKF